MKLKYHKRLFVLYLDSEVPGDIMDKKFTDISNLL